MPGHLIIAGQSMQEEDENFVIDTPEDYFAYEEMVYPETSKCRKKGKKKRDKFVVPGKEKMDDKVKDGKAGDTNER